MCICFANYFSKHFTALTVTTRGKGDLQHSGNERWGYISFCCFLTMQYMLSLCIHWLEAQDFHESLKLHL